MKKYVKKIQEKLENTLKGYLAHWSFLGLGSEKKWCGTCSGRSNGSSDRTAEKMLENFQTKNWSPNLSMHQRL